MLLLFQCCIWCWLCSCFSVGFVLVLTIININIIIIIIITILFYVLLTFLLHDFECVSERDVAPW